MNLLLSDFFQTYGLLIILVVAFALIMVYYYMKNKKFQETENNFQTSLKKGDKVKTYSGFYGTVEKITDTTDGKVVTLKLGKNVFIDIDIRALMNIDTKTEITEEMKAADGLLEEKPAEETEAVEEEPKKVDEEKTEETVEIEEEKPKKVKKQSKK